jgi:hypothetical protein
MAKRAKYPERKHQLLDVAAKYRAMAIRLITKRPGFRFLASLRRR